MKTLGNIIWLVFHGFWMAVGWALSAALLAITVVGIPFGIQAFKFIPLALFPFGKEIVRSKDLRSPGAAAAHAA